MKNTAKLFGIIAFAAVLAFSFISCEEDSGSAFDSELIGKWYVLDADGEKTDEWVEFKEDKIVCSDGGLGLPFILAGAYDAYDGVDGVELCAGDGKIYVSTAGGDVTICTYKFDGDTLIITMTVDYKLKK